jgi:hypothetical protein
MTNTKTRTLVLQTAVSRWYRHLPLRQYPQYRQEIAARGYSLYEPATGLINCSSIWQNVGGVCRRNIPAFFVNHS